LALRGFQCCYWLILENPNFTNLFPFQTRNPRKKTRCSTNKKTEKEKNKKRAEAPFIGFCGFQLKKIMFLKINLERCHTLPYSFSMPNKRAANIRRATITLDDDVHAWSLEQSRKLGLNDFSTFVRHIIAREMERIAKTSNSPAPSPQLINNPKPKK
jgi:hypothetical protein